MTKILFPILGFAILAGTVASANPQSVSSRRALENYDIRDEGKGRRLSRKLRPRA